MYSVDFAKQHPIDMDGATSRETRHHKELYFTPCAQKYLDIPI